MKMLKEVFRQKLDTTLAACADRGVEMRLYSGVRSAAEQARLWRQSRTLKEINRAVRWLKSNGADYLSEILISVGPQYGRWATNALPGFSWHQWGTAGDAFWVVEDDACWDVTMKINGVNGYAVYTEEAAKAGLICLGPVIGDWVHVQERSASVGTAYSIREIDAEMKLLR